MHGVGVDGADGPLIKNDAWDKNAERSVGSWSSHLIAAERPLGVEVDFLLRGVVAVAGRT